METLIGRFILNSGQGKLNPFAGSLLFACTAPSELLIVNPLYDAYINPTHHTELRGKFLDSTLRGMRVFEAYCGRTLSEVTASQPSTFDIGNEVYENFVGTITLLSQCFKLKNGPTVFLTLSLSGGSHTARLMLLVDAVQLAQYLHVGDLIEVSNVTRFRWKVSATTQSQLGTSQNISSTQDTVPPDSQQKSYYIDQPSNIRILQQAKRFEYTSHSTTNSVSPNDLLNPRSLLQKEEYANTEFSYLVGTVRSVYPSGCVELVNVTIYKCEGKDSDGADEHVGNDGGDHQLDIYDLDSYPAESYAPANNASQTTSSSVCASTTTSIQLPHTVLYLSQHMLHHLRQTALGVSVRKTATILVHSVIPVFLYGRNKGFATTCRSNLHIVRFANNTHFLSHDANHCSVSINVCKEYKNCCILYTVWREETRRKLAHCVQVDTMQHSKLFEDIVQHMESRGSFASNDKTAAANGALVRNVLALVPPIAVQDELYNLQYTLLYTIRNGLDADYIGNNLPQVYSVSAVIAKLLHMHESSPLYCHENVYGLYHYDLCSVQQNLSYWNQHHQSSNSRPRRKNIVLLGTVVHVNVPNISLLNKDHCSTLCARVRMVDALGKSITAVINSIDASYVDHLHAVCTTRLTRLSSGDQVICSGCSGYNHSTTTTSKTTRDTSLCIDYCAPCVCNTHHTKPPLHTKQSLLTSAIPNPLYLSIQYPVGLIEKQPSLSQQESGTEGTIRYKYLVVADQKDVTFLNAADILNNATVFRNEMTSTTAVKPTTVRQILTTNLGQHKQKYMSSLHCMVVNKQVLSVEYKKDANNDTHEQSKSDRSDNRGNNEENKYKKRRLVTQYSVSENVEYSDRLNNISTSSTTVDVLASTTAVNTAYNAYSLSSVVNNGYANINKTSTASTPNDTTPTAKKCCLTLRDANYPDTINLYIPLTYVNDVHVGHIVCVTDLYACIPESRKKMYLKLTEENKTKIDVTGMADGAQLRSLCELSRTIPDPRFIDTMYTHNAAQSVYNGSTGITGTKLTTHSYNNNMAKSSIPYTLHSICEHYIQAPPPTTISELTPQCSYNRAVYTLTGQVTFIRKLHITLRCTNCSSSAKRCNRLGGYICTKCTACYTIKPLWEVYIAFDDGTGECNMHIEGEQVFNVIRAKYDMCSKILWQLRKLVDNYVQKYGSLLYDAFDQSVSEYNKPYSEAVQAAYIATNAANTANNTDNNNTSATTGTAAATLYTTRSNLIFDMPLSERTNCLVSFIDLTTNSSNTKIPLILRSYIQLASYSTQFSVYCRVDYNTGVSTATASDNNSLVSANSNTTKSKREVKLQRNNADKPYLAYFVSRPTYSGTKLTMQGLFARELHGEGLNKKSWELLKKLQK